MDRYFIADYSQDNMKFGKCICPSYNDEKFSHNLDAEYVEGNVSITFYTHTNDLYYALVDWLRYIEDHDDKKMTVIISCDDEEDTKSYARCVVEFIKRFYLPPEFTCIVYVENCKGLLLMESDSQGYMKVMDKRKLAVYDFLARYPLSSFLLPEQIDCATATLKPDVNVNVAMIGFGKRNRLLFNGLVSTNQFAVIEDGDVKQKPVNYYLYCESEEEKVCGDFDYFRYVNEYAWLKATEDKYLPIVPIPANDVFLMYDATKICDDLKSKLSNKWDLNCVIVDFINDEINVELANAFAKCLDGDVKIFVYVQKPAEQDIDSRCIVIGDTDDTVYNLQWAIGDSFADMARDKHLCYVLENSDAQNEDEVAIQAKSQWDTFSTAQRESNLYACLSIRPKLNMLGFDISKADGAVDVSDEFLKIYQANDEITYSGRIINGRSVVDYGDCNFKENTLRNNFAKHEHMRWNAYEICCGYVPANIEEIKNKTKAQLIFERKHRNITSYEGLIQYKRLIAKPKGITEAEADVIKYDYQIMDDVVWLLHNNGYKIVYR